MDFATSLIVAASGMRAQSDRMKTIAENLANANSAATTAGGDPYRRKIPTMTSEFDREIGATLVTTGKPISMPRISPRATSRAIRWPTARAM